MANERPNILLITADQQRYDASGSAGPSFLRTPHFDSLAREGVTFTRAYADCPICVPSRVSIMTGKTVFSHGGNSNCPTSKVMGNRDTLPAMLRSAGYQTAAIGKMHFGPERCRHGFDEMILPADYYRWMHETGRPLQPMRHGLGQNELYPTMATVPESLTLTNWIADQCLHYIRDRRDPTVPFFLWCSFSKPHPPLDPPEPYYSMYRNCPIPAPVYGDWSDDAHCPEAFKRHRQSWSIDLIPPEIIREARAAYYGLITQIDFNMGRVFGALQDLDLFRDTLIIYTSDHGEYLGDFHAGSKIFFHECSAHVPMLLRMPKNWPDRRHGDRCHHLTTLADVLPTCLSAAGATPPAGLDGLDLISLARGAAQTRQYLEATSAPGLEYFGITDGRWKYTWWVEGGSEQLFDIEADPREEKNLAHLAEYSGKRNHLYGELVRRHLARNSPWVKDGRMVSAPLKGDSVADRRNNSWPGYHSEYFDVDVRH